MIMSKTISVSQIKEAAQEAYEQFKDNTGGKNADYIPYLANIDKNLFGISICLLDGRTITLPTVSGSNPFRKYIRLSWHFASTEPRKC